MISHRSSGRRTARRIQAARSPIEYRHACLVLSPDRPAGHHAQPAACYCPGGRHSPAAAPCATADLLPPCHVGMQCSHRPHGRRLPAGSPVGLPAGRSLSKPGLGTGRPVAGHHSPAGLAVSLGTPADFAATAYPAGNEEPAASGRDRAHQAHQRSHCPVRGALPPADGHGRRGHLDPGPRGPHQSGQPSTGQHAGHHPRADEGPCPAGTGARDRTSRHHQPAAAPEAGRGRAHTVPPAAPGWSPGGRANLQHAHEPGRRHRQQPFGHHRPERPDEGAGRAAQGGCRPAGTGAWPHPGLP